VPDADSLRTGKITGNFMDFPDNIAFSSLFHL
jgi:hypothetical protein